MDRVLMLRRSGSRKSQDDQEDGKKDQVGEAKEVHRDKFQEVPMGELDVDDVDDTAGNEEQSNDSIQNLPIPELTCATDLRLSNVESEIGEFEESRELEKDRSMEQRLDEASSSDPLKGLHLWDARKSSERFSRLREKILEKYYSNEIYPVTALHGEDVKTSARGPVKVRSNPSDEPHQKLLQLHHRNVTVADGSNSHQSKKEGRKQEVEPVFVFKAANDDEDQKLYAEVEKSSPLSQNGESHDNELESQFVFTAGSEWGSVESSLTFENSWQSTLAIGAEKDKTVLTESRSKIRRHDTTVYRIWKTSKSRNGGKGKPFRDFFPCICFGSSHTMGSQSLENLLTAESRLRKTEKTESECVEILRNLRASQKAHQEARKLARQYSAAERARLTAELQTIARGCSISRFNSSTRESWESIKMFFCNLFCNRRKVSECKKTQASARETTSTEEVTASDGIEQKSTETETRFGVDRLISLPGFPHVQKKRIFRDQKSASCGFELERAIAIRNLQKDHSD